MLMPLQKMHKRVHDIVAPRQPLLDDPSISKSLCHVRLCSKARSNSVPVVSGGDGTFNPFYNHRFSGSLRPVYPLSPPRIVPEHIKRPDYAESGRIMGFVRGVKAAV